MSADAGKHMGEAEVVVTIPELVSATLSNLSTEQSENISFVNEAGEIAVRLPVRTFMRTIKGLITNALDASPPGSTVTLLSRKDVQFLYFDVLDQGGGMEPESVNRATDPFFTTKEQGKGMGLGLYLARTVAEWYGGRLVLESIPGKGTSVTLSISLQRISGKE